MFKCDYIWFKRRAIWTCQLQQRLKTRPLNLFMFTFMFTYKSRIAVFFTDQKKEASAFGPWFLLINYQRLRQWPYDPTSWRAAAPADPPSSMRFQSELRCIGHQSEARKEGSWEIWGGTFEWYFKICWRCLKYIWQVAVLWQYGFDMLMKQHVGIEKHVLFWRDSD